MISAWTQTAGNVFELKAIFANKLNGVLMAPIRILSI